MTDTLRVVLEVGKTPHETGRLALVSMAFLPSASGPRRVPSDIDPNRSGEADVKAMSGILPYAVVLAVLGVATWWLLSRGMAAGPWLLAAVLIGHGVVHTMFAISPAPTPGGPEWPFDMARSWPVTGAGLDLDVVRALGLTLIVIVAGGFAIAALSTVGLVVPAGWWQAAVGGSAVTSIVVLVLFFHPQLVLGLGIDAVLLWTIATGAWTPA